MIRQYHKYILKHPEQLREIMRQRRIARTRELLNHPKPQYTLEQKMIITALRQQYDIGWYELIDSEEMGVIEIKKNDLDLYNYIEYYYTNRRGRGDPYQIPIEQYGKHKEYPHVSEELNPIYSTLYGPDVPENFFGNNTKCLTNYRK